jgi:pilus assembly protein Flp/PilA
MLKQVTNFCRDEEGATAIEYGLVAALMAVAAITAFTQMSSTLNNIFTMVSNTLGNVVATL